MSGGQAAILLTAVDKFMRHLERGASTCRGQLYAELAMLPEALPPDTAPVMKADLYRSLHAVASLAWRDMDAVPDFADRVMKMLRDLSDALQLVLGDDAPDGPWWDR